MTQQIKRFESAVSLLPPSLRQAYAGLRPDQKAQAEEIRLRVGTPPSVTIGGREVTVGEVPVEPEGVAQLLERATRSSLHTVAEELKEGFITVGEGHRLGIAGTGVVKGGTVTTMRAVSSAALRIAREHKGCAQTAVQQIWTPGKPFPSTLLVSPPGVGKTTFLRDIIRIVSTGGLRVGVVDERRELAALQAGVPCFDLGPHADVMEGVPKAEAAMLLVRTMAPDVLAVDEITASRDVVALEQAVNCGVSVIATVHGSDLEDVLERPALRGLRARGHFACAAFLRRTGESGRTARVEKLDI